MNALDITDRMARGGARILRRTGPALLPGDRGEAVARWAILLLLGTVAVTALSVHRQLMWVALAGVLAATYAAGRTDESADSQDDDHDGELAWLDPADTLDLVRELIGDRRGVLLTGIRAQLQEELPDRQWTPQDVRALLDEAGIRVRAGVRVRDVGNGPGVHRDDLPPLPSPAPEEAQVGVVDAGQDANTNPNNIEVDEFGAGGYVLRDPVDHHRHHTIGDH